MVPAIAVAHKMVPVKTIINAVLHVSFLQHHQIDAFMHKVVPEAGIVARKWYQLWYQQKITQKIVSNFRCNTLLCLRKIGAGDEIRTHDIYLGNSLVSQIILLGINVSGTCLANKTKGYSMIWET